MGIPRKSHSFKKEAWTVKKQHQSFWCWRLSIPKSRLLNNSGIEFVDQESISIESVSEKVVSKGSDLLKLACIVFVPRHTQQSIAAVSARKFR